MSNPIPVLFVGLERGLKNELLNECVCCIWGGNLGGASGFRSFANGFMFDVKNNTCVEAKSQERAAGRVTAIPHSHVAYNELCAFPACPLLHV